MSTNPLSFMKGVIGRTFYVIPQRPERIQIEVTNRCNYRCGMCPREFFRLPEKDIAFHLFTQIVDRLTLPKFSRYTITLTGWGEPLLHPELINMILYTKHKGYAVGVTTNGSLLASYVESFRKIPLDKLTISLDNIEECNSAGEGHPPDNIVQENIETLIRSRDMKKMPHITIQITMHNKQQCLKTVKFAGEIGADRVYLVRLNNPLGRGGFKRPDLKEELEIYQAAEVIAKNYGLQVDSNYGAFGNGFIRLVYKQVRPVMYRFDRYCSKPYDYVYITIDGKVTPCCDLPRNEVGNILKQNLSEIWHGENIHYFRKHQGEICGKCDTLRLKHFN
ncbi:MAG: radical SAM protein [wastewater metagenome]|nr:radical SAM protein [Candidatus Loosdrechtia aerotolerans]